MYYTHNLRVQLQGWVNRLYKTSWEHFPSEISFFFKNISSHPLLLSILTEAEQSSANVASQVEHIVTEFKSDYHLDIRLVSFKSRPEKAAFHFRLLDFLITSTDDQDIMGIMQQVIGGDGFDEQKEALIEGFVRPITNYLEDQLEEGSSALYLLEKYKRRTENFLAKKLLAKYEAVTNQTYEQVFDDDLRLYLFDQGIDHPYSTPKSASGRVDIASGLDTSDPLILEIKVFDKAKSYGKERIRSGFNQALKYARDYNKSTAYLAVFVLDDVEIELTDAGEDKAWPNRIAFNNCHYHFIFVYLNRDKSASKSKTSKISISLNDLISHDNDVPTSV